MTLTYLGRVQTRLFALVFIGGLWTLIITPLLPSRGALQDKYHATFIVLAAVFAIGVIWDGIYYLFQQFRWEKDWPNMFGLLAGINEGIVVWEVLRTRHLPGHADIGGGAFCIHFITVWLLTWMFTIGPMRVPFLRWRFRGGRLI